MAGSMSEWHWGEAHSGWRFGLRAQVHAAAPVVDLVAIARNEAGQEQGLSGSFFLQIASNGVQEEFRGGPRSGAPVPFAPGEEMEFASWRITTSDLDPGRHACVLVYEMDPESTIHSGSVEFDAPERHGPFPSC